MRRSLFGIGLAALLAASPAGADDDAIFGRARPPEPFEREPFREVRIPDWVQDTVGCGYTLSVMGPEARAEAARHGVAISEMGFVNPFFACYDSALIHGRSPDWPPGRIEREIEEYKRLGVRILAVVPPTLQGEVYRDHPEWRRIATDTTEIPVIDLEKYPHGGMLCPLGPYGDFLIEILAEVLTRFPDVDAFSFDGLHHGGGCYCAACRENYRRDTGREIPPPDLNDPAFRRYQHWADRRLEDLVRGMQRRLKGIKPTVALVTWSTNAGRFGHFLSIPRNMPARLNLLFDAPDQEFWLDETNRGNTIVPAFANATIWGMTDHRVAFSEPYLLSHGNPYGKDSFPPPEIERRMMLAVTYGAAPSLAVAQPSRLQGEVYRYLDRVQELKPYLVRKEPEPWAALLLSDDTRTFYGRDAGRVERRYLAHPFGAFRACVEAHLPTVVVNDWNLSDEDLSRYAVLILPNAACLDDRAAAAVERFVARGGGLVASLDTSLCDEFGDVRPDFALADVLGVTHQGRPDEPPPTDAAALDANFARSLPADYWEKRQGVFDVRFAPGSPLDDGRLATYVGTDPVTFKGPAVRVSARPGTRVVATMRAKDAAGAEELPAILLREHGRGRVVYLAAGLDAACYLYAYPYQRLALAGAIRWAAASPPPVEVEAPMCVHATVMRQRRDGADRLIVHLFNDANTTGGHALPDDDVPLREEVLPVHDIAVTFAPRFGVARAHLEPGGVALEVRTAGGGARVLVPRLDVHAALVVELAADAAP